MKREALLIGLMLGGFVGGVAGTLTIAVFVWHYLGIATGWW